MTGQRGDGTSSDHEERSREAPSSGANGPHTGIPAARSGHQPVRLPRLLTALCDRLPDDRLTAWEQAFARLEGPDDPFLARFVAAQPAAGLAWQVEEITRAWRDEAPSMPGDGLALALAALRALPRPRPVQPVVSGPLSTALPARLTRQITLEIIRSANDSLLIASFAAHGATDTVAEIAAAVGRGVTVDLLLEKSTNAAAAFAALPPQARVWHRTGAATGVLHAKLIAADRHTALIGSANLTDRALDDNIELGVVLRDPSAVGPVVDHFRWLIAPNSGLMRRVRTGHLRQDG